MENLKTNFIYVSDSLKAEEEARMLFRTGRLSYGISFVDDVTGGIFKNDLVIATSKTGIGKTEFATTVAQVNAIAGKRVHYFALEADPQEVTRRIKYRMLANRFYDEIGRSTILREYPNYTSWLCGKQDDLFKPFENNFN